MRKKKTGIKVSRTNATSANLAKPSKPKHRYRRLLIVCGVVVVLVGLAIAGDDYLQLPWLEEMYHRECGGKSSSTNKEQVSAEEKCLRPHIERIFGKDAEFGVEFRLCKKDGVDKRSFADLSQMMRICKEKTAGMTEDQILYANDGLDHGYHLYIYDPDGQSVKTDGDKAKIIERLKKMVKYLPDGRSDSMWLCYFIKQYKGSGWGSELKVSVDDLRQMTDSFSDDLLKPIVTNDGGTDPYPIRKGWDK